MRIAREIYFCKQIACQTYVFSKTEKSCINASFAFCKLLKTKDLQVRKIRVCNGMVLSVKQA